MKCSGIPGVIIDLVIKLASKKIPLLGQYACGECGRKIKGIFANLYYLGKPGADFRLPDSDKGFIPPNVMICRRHIQYFPLGVIDVSPLEGVVNFGLRQSDAVLSQVWWNGVDLRRPVFQQDPPDGYFLARAFQISDLEEMDFLSDASAREYFPNAMKFIVNYACIGGKRMIPPKLDG